MTQENIIEPIAIIKPIAVTELVLNEVYSVRSIDATNSALLFSINVTEYEETHDIDYVFRLTDRYGLAPILSEWLDDNPDFDIEPFEEPAAPTAEELRARMPSITPRQLRLTLVRSGIPLKSVTDAIAALPEGLVKSETEIEWEYATTFERNSVALVTIAGALQMSAEDVDALWHQAMAA